MRIFLLDIFFWLIDFYFINIVNNNGAGNITLNISRARISSSKCCVPTCNVQLPAELHRIPLGIRYDIMKTKRFFIPQTAKACNFHLDYSVWPEIIIPNQNCVFTATQIEEMVDLLRSNPRKSKDKLLGK